MKNFLKQVLDERQINQKQLAQESGLTESAISRYIKNDRKPNGDAMLKIAKILNCNVEDIWKLEE